jgi:hypothetical protein
LENLLVAYRLRNQSNPKTMLGVTVDAWHKILYLAEVHGWRPLSLLGPGNRDPFHPTAGIFLGRPLILFGETHHDKIGLVVMEDALNLADALERAFMAYDPIFLPADYFYFGDHQVESRLLPGIGAITEVIEFCKLGTFWIEPFRNGNKKS